MYTPILYDLKPLRKMFISISHETTLQCHFVQKIYLIFKGHFNAFFNKRFILWAHMSLNFSNLHTTLLMHDKMCVVMTNECFGRGA